MDNIDNIIERIKKAVRLANKTPEAGERDTAMRLARQLAERNGVAFEEILNDNHDSGRQVHESSDWGYGHGVIDGHACVILRQHFGVVVMLHTKGVMRKYTYFGSSLNIGIAKYVNEILHREAQKAWREVKKATEFELGFEVDKKSFMRGWFFRIHKKLTEHPIRNDLEQFEAERKAAEDQFKKYSEKNNVRLSNIAGTGKNNDDASLYHGFMMADRVSLNRPCEAGGTGAGAAQVGRQVRIGMRR